jgi:hypothetical protein
VVQGALIGINVEKAKEGGACPAFFHFGVFGFCQALRIT